MSRITRCRNGIDGMPIIQESVRVLPGLASRKRHADGRHCHGDRHGVYRHWQHHRRERQRHQRQHCSGPQTTTYAYTYYSSTEPIYMETVTSPAVKDQTDYSYNLTRRPPTRPPRSLTITAGRFGKRSASGYTSYMEYDSANRGAHDQADQDVNTSAICRSQR